MSYILRIFIFPFAEYDKTVYFVKIINLIQKRSGVVVTYINKKLYLNTFLMGKTSYCQFSALLYNFCYYSVACLYNLVYNLNIYVL